MKKWLLLLVSYNLFAITNCDALYEKRGQSLEITEQAIECFSYASNLNKVSYLLFFKATYFEADVLRSLIDSYGFAKKQILKYGNMFDFSSYDNLSVEEKRELALAYYQYGTSVSKYVEYKGKFEAVKRMKEIKSSMKMILRLKEPQTFFYGAYRTLAILNYKVPKIAGGDLRLAKKYFEKLMNLTSIDGLSDYPVNHIFYAQFLYTKNANKQKACSELKKVMGITDREIESRFESIRYETLKDRKDAALKYKKYSC
ncbi:MAG: TRAP transporter TatT component family protein [Bacteriovoracaceae bacterium]|nr:TRAP transporter TatT component family protein [Bacteriovoracaceae bacterium]